MTPLLFYKNVRTDKTAWQDCRERLVNRTEIGDDNSGGTGDSNRKPLGVDKSQ